MMGHLWVRPPPWGPSLRRLRGRVLIPAMFQLFNRSVVLSIERLERRPYAPI